MVGSNLLDAYDQLGAALGAAGDTVLSLALDLVYEDRDNPRQVFDEAELTALAETIKSRGLLQPIIVRPADADGRYRIRFGARRYRAAVLAKLAEIKAIARGGEEPPAESLIEQLIENDQREGLSTAELAAAVERLVALGLSQTQIGHRLGRPKAQISMLASIRDMPAELQALAPQLGLRTLYELSTAWKVDVGRAKVWLSGRDPKTITQAEARALAGRPVADRRVVRDPSDGAVTEVARTSPPSPASDPPKPASSVRAAAAQPTGAATATFEVRYLGVLGTLVLDNVRVAKDAVRIRQGDGRIVSAPASLVRIVSVKPG